MVALTFFTTISLYFVQLQPFDGSIRDNAAKLVPELSETLSQYTTFIVVKFPTSLPNLPSKAFHYISRV